MIVVTGHRKINKSAIYPKLFKSFDHLKNNRGHNEIYIGMAKGFDMVACEAAMAADLKIHACIPYLGHWLKRSDQKEYFKILAHPDTEIHLISSDPYTKGALFKRNIWMVEQGDPDKDIMIAGYRKSIFDKRNSSGTGHTVGQARTAKYENIHCLDPDTLKWWKGS